jgi:hypothetical protein
VCACVRARARVLHTGERCEGIAHVMELFDYLTQQVTAHKHYKAF